MSRIRIIPKPDRTVYDPISKSNIDQSGKMVILNPYWNRLLMDGDIDIVDTEPLIVQNLVKKKGKRSNGN